MTSARYHINPETGNANKCQASVPEKCKFSKNGTRIVPHYDTKEDAQKGFERTMKAEALDVDNFSLDISDRLNIYNDNKNDRMVKFMFTNLFKDENNWTNDEKENLIILSQVSEILNKKEVSKADFKEVDKLISFLKPAKIRPKKYGWSSNDPVYRDKYLIELPKVLSVKKQWEQEEETLVVPRDKSDLREVFHNPEELNKAYASFIEDNSIYGNTNFGDEKYVDKALDEFEAGIEIKPKSEQYDLNMSMDWESTYMTPDKKILSLISQDKENDYYYNQQAYLALAFPNRELKDALKEQGVKNVKVDSFVNGREVGNVYTVYQPDGNARSFSVYEHRNTDSIIINGSTNWDKDSDTLPYAGESKHEFFSENSAGDMKQTANNLAFFLKEAQKGELPDDNYLANNAEKLDWTEIINKSIPGYKDWVKEKGFKINDLDPDDPRNTDN